MRSNTRFATSRPSSSDDDRYERLLLGNLLTTLSTGDAKVEALARGAESSESASRLLAGARDRFDRLCLTSNTNGVGGARDCSPDSESATPLLLEPLH